MSGVVITNAVALTALGDLADTWRGLESGRSALAPGVLAGELGVWPVGVLPNISAPFGSFARLEEIIDKVVAQLPPVPAETGLIISTTRGAADELFGAEPWSGQPWDLGQLVAGKIGLRGPVATVSAACASGTIALIDAAQRLKSTPGVEAFLVLGIDLLSAFVTSGFAKLHALAKDKCRPFDSGRDGLALGEGGGALMVTTLSAARRSDRPILARVKGWGVSGDAGHITAPCREARGLIRALGQCTAGGGYPVGAINAHGTGTTFNDAMEIKAFADLFGNLVPFHSIKGAVGHCLGAAGVIEAAIALKSLAVGRIPPTVGLREPEDNRGNISGAKSLELVHPSIISCNSGFGGINAAVLLEKEGFAQHD